MKFKAEIDVMPQEALLDPQGKTVARNMENAGIKDIDDVRIGKHIRVELDAASEDEAREKVEKACRNLLANLIMETYSYKVFPADEATPEKGDEASATQGKE